MTYYSTGKQVLRRTEETPRYHICDARNDIEADLIATRLNEYSSAQYMQAADATNSTIFKPEQVNALELRGILVMIAQESERLNVIKKLLVRGKTCEEMGVEMPVEGEGLDAKLEFGPHAVNVLHGLIGAITETGEMAEALVRWIDTGELDTVNVNEECGDVFWYIVRQLRGVDRSIEHCMQTNIDKLHGRHGEKFDPFKDANRDLDAERKRLEAAEQEQSGQGKFALSGDMDAERRVVPGTEDRTLG